MTSSRGQNVSVLPRSDTESVTVFADAGGSLRSASRKISLKTDKTPFRNEKSFGQQFVKTLPTNAFVTFKKKDYSSVSKCSNPSATGSAKSSSFLNSINRELSPVRWCDREVDGVYLGRSGWVQVQQRSFDDCKNVLYSENTGFSTLPCRKNYSELNSDCRFEERKECDRFLNLPLPTKKRIIRDDHEKSSKFIQKLESASPPSITPIISPPPAFKDNGFGAEFSRQTLKESYFCKKSFPQRSEMTAVSEILPGSLLERRNALNSSSSTIRTESCLPSPLKHQRSLNETSNAKYFEDGYSHKMWRSRCLDSTSRFRSLDDETRMANEQELSVGDFFRRSFENPGIETVKKKKEKDIETEEIDNNKYFLKLQSSSWEALNDQRFLSKTFSRLNYQGDRRQNFAEDRWNSYRTRSSSLDSNSSNSNDSSSSSSSSRRSSTYKNVEKTVSRKTDSKQSQQSKFENSLSRDCRHFNVKRSRSLQLSEKRSPSESGYLNNSLSENSWNPVLLETSTGRIKNQNKESFPQHSLNHVFVTVNGESIPVVTSSSQSAKSLNKITKSAVEQKKLIMEAEKEARIISEFMNGTRSRAAARNLLMHRYLNQPEDVSSTALTGRNNSQKTERFIMSNQSPTNKRNSVSKTYFDGGSSSKKNQFNPLVPDPRQYFKPLTSVFSNSYQKESFTSFHNCPNQRKPEQVENKDKEKSHLVFSEQADGNLSKHKRQNTSFSLDRASLNSKALKERPEFLLSQKQKLNTLDRLNTKKVECEFTDTNLKTRSKRMAKNPSAKTLSGVEKRNFGNNGFLDDSLTSSPSSSSSSSSDICLTDFSTKFKKTKKIRGSSPHFKGHVPETNFRILKDNFCSRPGSAPESESCNSKGIDKRSLSLPRSFLSERYRLNNCHQRNLLTSKQGHSKTPAETPEECRLNLQSSKTAPTTPVCDLRYGKSTESLYQIPSYRSSCVSLFGETPIFMSRRIIQERSAQKFERSAETSDEINSFCADEHSLNISDSSSKTVLQKFKKNFSLKYLKRKENLKDNIKSINDETEGENVDLCIANGLTFNLQANENDNNNLSEQTHGFLRRKSFEKRAFRNEKYDSLDSGIQMINRGILDSSESQDTDIQEDADSPLVVRRYEIRPKPKSEVINHILTNKYKAALCRRIKKRDHGKVVKRSYSDLGDLRLLNWDVKKNGERLNFYSSALRDSNATTTLSSPCPEVSSDFNRSERLLKPRLRRSLSQPLGFYDLPPIERRKPLTLKGSALREGEKNPRQRKSEDEFLSDSESSACSLYDRMKPREETTVLAEAVWDHVAIESDELPFKAGDVVEVLDTRNKDWWWGATKENSGYFPSAFVRLRVSQEDTVEDCLAAMARGKSFSKQLRRGKSVSFLSNDQVRSRIVRELLNTERDFVKILQDVKDGYLTQCKQRNDMFTSAQITTIFSNLEDLLAFQNKFLHDLEANIDKEFPFKSCIGEVFLNHGSSFQMYSEYCNSHPMAIATLQNLYKKYNYCKFFEMCRLKQRLIEIPLDGYLLTPVQRICKYPLQLGELLKYTKPDHPDYKNVQEALDTMKSVATLINERKRKMESLEKLAAWQQRVEGWEGEDLIEVSSQLIHQGDVVKITSGMWTTNITLFLFDHQIIYCKKDLLKKNVFIYKGRISLDESDVTDIPDGKCQQLGVSIKYGLKINNKLKDKWLVFCCRSNEDKIKWLEALAEEKKLVALDKERNLDLPPTTKQLAKMAVQTNKYPSDKLKGKNKFALNRDSLLTADNHSGVSKSKSNKRIGMWFHFGGMMKNTKASLKPRTSHHRFT